MATMRSSASSNGPGMGARPSAASPRSGRGMRLSVAAIFRARRVLFRLLMEQRDLQRGDFYRTVLASVRAAERRRRVGACAASGGRCRGAAARPSSAGPLGGYPPDLRVGEHELVPQE
jgi:hypothetical protein